mmetsp:Transcript_13466/g.16322  ORF Transcript_13466/g.16322 Transcript_13466/m.16322 type:complete len:158 (+) Transcript_13466:156-629(+)
MEHSQLVCVTYLEDLTSACANKGHTSKAGKLKELHNRENMREECRRIKSAVGKRRGVHITSLKFSDEHGVQQEAFGKRAIVSLPFGLSLWNKMKESTNSNGDLHFGYFKAAMTHKRISLVVHYLLRKFRIGLDMHLSYGNRQQSSCMKQTSTIIIKG